MKKKTKQKQKAIVFEEFCVKMKLDSHQMIIHVDHKVWQYLTEWWLTFGESLFWTAQIFQAAVQGLYK